MRKNIFALGIGALVLVGIGLAYYEAVRQIKGKNVVIDTVPRVERADLRFGAHGNFDKAMSGEGLRAPGTETLEGLLALSSDVVIGRVVKKNDARQTSDAVISTYFSVEILKPLKGELAGTVMLRQPGGLLDGKWQIFEDGHRLRGDVSDTKRLDAILLQEGKTYLLVMGTDPRNQELGVYGASFAHVDLEIDPRLSAEEARAEAEKAPAVKEAEQKLQIIND